MTEKEVIDFYQTNGFFYEYLNKYCDKHKLTVSDAVKHKIVIETAQYYKALEEENRNIIRG